MHSDRQTDRHADRQADRGIGCQIDIQTKRQADRQTFSVIMHQKIIVKCLLCDCYILSIT